MMARRPHLSRRSLVTGSVALGASSVLPVRLFAAAPSDTPLHGLSAFGDLKYGPDFSHFGYLNPDAPKGGAINFSPPNWAYNQNVQTFNTLNSFVQKGDAPPRMELCFDSLMARALDEPDAVYGLLAESVSLSEDRNSFSFKLRANARFHDNTEVTADDVAFTYLTYRDKGHPSLLLPLTELAEAVAEDKHTVRLTFTGKQSERTILNVVQFPILSRSHFEKHPFDGSELVAPLGSGPYRVARFAAGQSVDYERVENYWAGDLPVVRGSYNFDKIRIEFYRERQTAFEAFKKGTVTYRQEFTSKTWATEYDFPALQDGKVIRREFPSEKRPSMQGWAINRRRAKFSDSRVSEAIGLCFDFEWTRENMFYGSYTRSQSLFERSEFRAEGPPSEAEQALIAKLGDVLNDDLSGEPIEQPVSNGSGRDRNLLRQASRLLTEAGWKREEGSRFLADAKGERLTVEILVRDQVFVRVDTPFVENMRLIGIDASIRLVDPPQYQSRINDFEFDIMGTAYSLSATPTRDDLQNLFSSRAADIPGSRNYPGTKDAGVDALIEEVGAAQNRHELVTAMRVLDRLLRKRRDWIPNWYSANHRAAYWDLFGFVEPKPDYGFPIEAMWWYDEEKAAAIGRS